ncbi:hypothetical protein [Legionella quateirensis]|uniref:Transmembrane protein n=1 Tax=Legionella quateirensis TaxID=45072 RepID=A0A378PAS0_9GAMM|nr:hypothetical protein [Legionella quateirensis]KTD44139.1 hypothetical protein Lqua_2959 [Legionella quateirensis]STY82964.1 Uncharacterised protein [Legionella quateirensis]
MKKSILILALIFSSQWVCANTITQNWIDDFSSQNQYTKDDCLTALSKIKKSAFQRGQVDFRTTVENLNKQYLTKEDCFADLNIEKLLELKRIAIASKDCKYNKGEYSYNRCEEAAKVGLPVNYIPIPTRVNKIEAIGALTLAKFKLEDAANTVFSNLNITIISLVLIIVLLFIIYKKVSILTKQLKLN